ncbi:hypothetical protein EXU85_18915 [Spirosoma sp. KCTC 42546]|uniref:hypothetical protein n=1 Tax=Spirosoma sp. KCTC 42546 TaxID=2520506 RepID=UPI00115B3B4F|nr:hypothetical protein [Spirosoma sp. KCTC 42546]QDK80563.1 hypothetical protein EXU85_18915 [Spirosoma sp. KCTC 42546]
MYLEERVEQLETLAVDQSKQSELIAKAVAKLTVDTQQGLDSLRKGQAELQQEVTRLADSIDSTNERVSQLDRKMDQRFEEVDRKMDQRFGEVDRKMDQRFGEVDRKMDQRFGEVNDKFAQIDEKQDAMRQDINGMRQDIAELKIGQELILQILREKLP